MSASEPTRVLVLGGEGALGHALVGYLRQQGLTRVAWTTRRGEAGGIPFDVLGGSDNLGRLFTRHGPFDWVVNCIAVLQSLINENDADSVWRAEQINGEFPHALATAAAAAGARVIHISTDAVFPAEAGRCGERTTPAPGNVYARTKLRGEVSAANVLNVRCSLVGPDPYHGRGLLEWLRSRPRGSRVPGFTDHLWVGATTLQVAQLCRQLIVERLFADAVAEGRVQHYCPCAPLSKYHLLLRLAAALGVDVEVSPVVSARPVSRQLDTDYRVLAAALPKYAPIEPALGALASWSCGPLRATG